VTHPTTPSLPRLRKYLHTLANATHALQTHEQHTCIILEVGEGTREVVRVAKPLGQPMEVGVVYGSVVFAASLVHVHASTLRIASHDMHMTSHNMASNDLASPARAEACQCTATLQHINSCTPSSIDQDEPVSLLPPFAL
jgi:hypothetical protein